MGFRSGFIVLLGRTNVGKSTLMNRIIGEKVSIISPKPQTTRNRIMGVVTNKSSQMVFVDTPGIHRGKKGLNRFMLNTALSAKNDADLIAIMIEARDTPHEIDLELIGGLSSEGPPAILLINKVDRVKKSVVLPLIDKLANIYRFETIIPISALLGDGVSDFLSEAEKLLPEGDPFFPEDTLTDVSERFLAGEIIREKVINLTHQEIPYAVAISVEQFSENEKRELLRISAVIYVERESQKGIVVGKGGSLIKEIGILARKDLEAFFGVHVFLDLRVKVMKDWAKRDDSLKRLGYR